MKEIHTLGLSLIKKVQINNTMFVSNNKHSETPSKD